MSHVVQVVYALGLGGSETLASAIAEAGVQRGTRMSLCGLYAGEQLRERLRSAGVETYVVGKRDGVRPAAMVATWRLLCQLQPTAVITHHLGQLVYSAVGARLSGARLLHVEHEWYSLDRKKARCMLRLGSMFADTIVVPARRTAHFMEHRVGVPGRKISVIRNGVDLKRFEFRKAPETQGPIVGTVGRLEPAKDQLTMLAAFRQILSSHPGARLVVVGEGKSRPSLESYVRDHGLAPRVGLMGARTDVERLLPGFDVFVLSSAEEGVPIALLEAMACGVPVVATDVGAVRETLAEGAIGRLVPPRSPEALARAVAELLDDRAVAAKLGEAGRRYVEKEHDLSKTVTAYLALCGTPVSSLEPA